MRLRRPSTPLVASIVVHLVVATLFVQALWLGRPLLDVFGRRHPAAVGPVERIGFLALPRPPAGKSATPGRRGGNGRRVTPTPVVPPVLVPPRAVPQSLPPRPSPSARPPRPSEESGTGPLIGGGGEKRGVQPRYDDPRLWGPPGTVATTPKGPTTGRGPADKSPAERLDSVVASVLGAHNDSTRVAAGSHRDPGDWTVEHNGRKYGVDRKFIRLGPVSIPTAVLAMLPLNVTNNPTVSDRERRFNAMHDEIFSQAQRAVNDADFEKAVRSIRERKERERWEREQAKRKAADSSAASADR